MTTATAITALFSLVSLAFLAFLLRAYRDYRIDYFRQRLFAIRDELFDLGIAKQLPFTHPAYGLLRSILNGFIRFAHQLGLFSLFWASTGSAQRDLKEAGIAPFPVQWEKALRGLDPKVQERLNDLVRRMHLLLMEQLVLTSVVLMAALIPVLCTFAVKASGQALLKTMRANPVWRLVRSKVIDPIDWLALAEGSVSP